MMNESDREPPRRSDGSRNDRPSPRPRKRTPKAGRQGGSSGSTAKRAEGEPARTRTSSSGAAGKKGPAPRRAPRPNAARASADKKGTARRRPVKRGTQAPRGKQRPKSPPRTLRGKIVRYVGLAALLAILAVGIGVGTLYASIVRDLPDPAADARGRDQTSVVRDRNGEILAQLFADQNRTDRSLDEIPQTLRQAVIATEDSRFYEHEGVDPLGIARALWVFVTTDARLQGGSTITQQYVKNAFITPERTVRRKLSEAILAYRIEQRYSKDQILELYLNTIYFGHGAYGVESAAQVYFGKSVMDLDLAESATLAGLIKAPGRFSPYLDPNESLRARRTVLQQMTEHEMITEEERAEAADVELALVGLGRTDVLAPYFMEYVKAQLIDELGADAVFRGGISVDTTLDLRMQRAAEEAVASILPKKDGPSAAVIAIDPRTGEIVAMVGGRDFSEKQFNVAVQGKRQPGSAFKPFVMIEALSGDVHAESTYERAPGEFPLPNGQIWSVTGAKGEPGPMRLREAMERSVNSVFAQLILDVGPESVAETARTMGIESEITPVPAIALGGHEEGVSPLEMASAYGTLATGGRHARPFAITSVSDANGEVLLANEPKLTDAIDPAIAYITTDVLRGVISRGTATAAAIGRPAAGKTGTTQRYRDAWFVGYTPELVTAVWVGYVEEQREMTDVEGRRVTGGSLPAKIWASFMKSALDGVPAQEFTRPDGVQSAPVCRESGETPTEWCTDVGQSIFLTGEKPAPCSVHAGPEVVAMPDLIGATKEDAIAKLVELGLKVDVTEEGLRGVPAGIVGRHNPERNAEVEAGSTVQLVVSSGTPRPPVPTASFTVSPTNPLTTQDVTFDGTGSSGSARIVRYVWEFGDGAEAEGQKATHRYTTPGTFTVILWVTDANNQTSSAEAQVVVR